MNKYLLKEGLHVEGRKTHHKKPKDEKKVIVVSRRPLAKLFPHKFEDLGPAAESAPAPSAPAPMESPEVGNEPTVAAPSKKKGKKSLADRFEE